MRIFTLKIFKAIVFSLMLLTMISSSMARGENLLRIPRGDLFVDMGKGGRLSLLAIGESERSLSKDSRAKLISTRANEICLGLGYLEHSSSKEPLIGVTQEPAFNIQTNTALIAASAEVFEELYCLVPVEAVKMNQRSRR